jgi:hypothetical protein
VPDNVSLTGSSGNSSYVDTQRLAIIHSQLKFVVSLNGLIFLLPLTQPEKGFQEQLHDLYCSPTIVPVIKSRRIRWAGHVTRLGEGRVVYRVLLGKSEGKRPVGRQRRRWENNINMDLHEVGYRGMDWIGRALVNAVMNLRVP